MAAVVRRYVNCSKAPPPGGVYSQAVILDRTMYLSGQVGRSVETGGKLVEGGIEAEAEQALKNIQAIMQEVGFDMNNIIKVTVMLDDIKDFGKLNQVYAKFFPKNPPARSCYEVAKLPVNAKVEIEAIAILQEIVDA